MKWTDEKHEQLRKMYRHHSLRYCAEQFGISYEAVKSRVDRLKFKHAPGYRRMSESVTAFTAEEKKFIQANYLKYPNHVLSIMMGRGESTIQKYRKILGIEGKENTGKFQKGIVPFNKGKKMPPGWSTPAMERTQFKKGHLPKNTKTDGHISVRVHKGRPYIWIRIKLGFWRELHRVMWEKTVGPIAKGYNIQFKDRNSLNCVPENLYIINKQNQMKENTIHRYDPELRSLIRLAGKLNRKIKEHEKQD